MMKKTILTASLLALAAGSGIAVAQSGSAAPDGAPAMRDGRGGGMGMMFRMADADNNGEVTRAEAEAAAAAGFARMDANTDGKLDESDRAAMKEKRGERKAMLFERLDTDGNGAVTKAEADAAAAAATGGRRGQMLGRLFAQADSNGDGQVTAAEFDAMEPGMGKREGRKGKWAGKRGGKGGMMQRADANGDGVVTRDEAVAGTMAMFDRIDTDRNGSVSAAERDAAMATMQAMRGKRGAGAAMPPPADDE